jgi:transposase
MIPFGLQVEGADMRGSDQQTGSLFSYVNLEERVPARHPLRKIKAVVDRALASLDADFSRLYADEGRPSIAPERLLRAALIQILFSIRSERQLMEQLEYNLLFRWFVGLSIDEPVWVPTVFSKNRDRLLTTDIARKLMAAILAHEKVAPLLSDDHFSVDGTLVEAWASFKSFKPKLTDTSAGPPDEPPPPDVPPEENASNTTKTETTGDEGKMTDTTKSTDAVGRNIERDFRGHAWSNATHASITDPDARLFRKGKGKSAQLCFMGHALMENRNGFAVEAEITHADGYGERTAALEMLHRVDPGSTRRLTLGADKGYDDPGFVADLKAMCVTPHIAAKKKGSALDGRTTRHPGYAVSQKKRKQIEEAFGWGKTVGPIRKTMLRGLDRVCAQFTLTMAAYNLAKLPNLLAA